MTELTLHLSDEMLERLRGEAERLNLPLDAVINTAIEVYLDDDEPTKEEILNSLRESMRDALAGRVRPAREVLAELRQEIAADGDEG